MKALETSLRAWRRTSLLAEREETGKKKFY